MSSRFLLLFWLLGASPVAAQDYVGRLVLGEAHARQQVLAATKGAPAKISSKSLLPTKTAAIAVAEPLLFKTFGQQHIEQERPYEAYLINGYWYISGTLPKGYDGGTFEVILAANDGRTLRLTHYK